MVLIVIKSTLYFCHQLWLIIHFWFSLRILCVQVERRCKPIDQVIIFFVDQLLFERFYGHIGFRNDRLFDSWWANSVHLWYLCLFLDIQNHRDRMLEITIYDRFFLRIVRTYDRKEVLFFVLCLWIFQRLGRIISGLLFGCFLFKKFMSFFVRFLFLLCFLLDGLELRLGCIFMGWFLFQFCLMLDFFLCLLFRRETGNSSWVLVVFSYGVLGLKMLLLFIEGK